MRIAIFISIILHIAALYTYPVFNLKDRKEHRQNVCISFWGILSEENFPIDKKWQISREPISLPLKSIRDKFLSGANFYSLKNKTMVWGTPGVSTNIEWKFLPEPVIEEEEINFFLKDGDKGVGKPISTFLYIEKPAPPLTEELEPDGK